MDLGDAFAMGEDLLAHHLPPSWTLEYDSAKRRAGICRFDRKIIGLSAPLTAVHSEAEVRDTILHEIAHALAGPGHGHDKTWRKIAVLIGSDGNRCFTSEGPGLMLPWLGTCSAGHSLNRTRRPERVMTCGQCSSRFDLAHVFTWTHHGRPAELHPNYQAELERVRAGKPLVLLRVGSRARVTAPGEYQGHVGKVVKRGRTSYHLRAGREVVRVPFAWVEPA
ncbi:MAG: SprT-like domain-containing protein [Nocardioides sp.]